jgi:hypothetical protein
LLNLVFCKRNFFFLRYDSVKRKQLPLFLTPHFSFLKPIYMKRTITPKRCLMQKIFSQALVLMFTTLLVESVAAAPETDLLNCPIENISAT